MKKTGVIIIILLISRFIYAVSDINFANNAMGLKELSISARATGLGGSCAAIADDGFAAYYNPAGLVQLQSMSINAASGFYNNDRMLLNGTYAHPFDFGTFSLGLSYFRLGGLEERSADNPSVLLSEFSDDQAAVQLAYARSLDKYVNGLAVGIKTEYLYQSLYEESAHGYAFSYGILYRFNTIRLLRNLSAGLVINNVPAGLSWSTGRDETIQTKYDLGLGYRLFNNHLILIAEMISIKEQPLDFNLGMEYDYRGFLVRGGVNRMFYNGGLGFRYQIYEINYCLNADTFGLNHQVSLSYKFGGKVEEELRAQVMSDVISERANNAYSEGVFHMDNARYQDAVKAFNLALLWDPDMKKAEEKLKQLRTHVIDAEGKYMDAQKRNLLETSCPSADILLKHYYAGINYYLENKIEEAISEWEFVLLCNPNYHKARKNIQRAELKLKALREKTEE